MFENYEPTELVLVDCETNGRDFERHVAVEVSWLNFHTRDHGTFVPWHRPAAIAANQELEAMQVNRYYERGLWRYDRMDHGHVELTRLWEQFVGEEPEDERDLEERPPRPKRIFMAVNPAFDANFISKLFIANLDHADVSTTDPVWAYHLRDLGSYAAGVLGLPTDHSPLRSREIAEICGVKIGNHTAEDDVRCLDECVRALADIAEACTEDEFETAAEVA